MYTEAYEYTEELEVEVKMDESGDIWVRCVDSGHGMQIIPSDLKEYGPIIHRLAIPNKTKYLFDALESLVQSEQERRKASSSR